MKSARTGLKRADISAALNDERKSLYYLEQAINSSEQSQRMIINGMTGNGIPMPFFT